MDSGTYKRSTRRGRWSGVEALHND